MENMSTGGLGNAQNDEGADLRYLPRWKVNNRVKFAVKDDESVIEECETLDLSCAGMSMRCSRMLIPGQSLYLKIYLDDDKAVEVDGRVVWNRITDSGRCVGIQFDTAGLDTQEEILNYAFEIKHDDLVRHWFSGWNEDSSRQNT